MVGEAPCQGTPDGAEVVLASTSPYRRALLERLGLSFSCRAPGVDEARLPDEPPSELVTRLALAKATAVAAQLQGRDCVVIGGDQVAEVHGTILTKPGSVEAAVAQLASLSGRTHTLWTGLAVLRPSQRFAEVHLDQTRLTMRAWPVEALQRYVVRDRPLDCAGSYRLELTGVCLFSAIAGPDPTAIEGMPLMALTRLLSEAGVSVV